MSKTTLNPGISDWEYKYKVAAAADIDGDGADELSLGYTVFDDVLANFSAYETFSAQENGYNQKAIAAGNLDGGDTDIKEELVYETVTADRYTSLGDPQSFSSNFTYNSIDVPSSKLSNSYSSSPDSGEEYNVKPVDLLVDKSAMVVGNFDRDSKRVRYDGHELGFTTPTIVATIASPPYYSGLAETLGDSYGYDSWSTTFGKSVDSSSTSTSSVGFSVGSSVEFEQEVEVFGVELATFSSSVAFEHNTSRQWSTTHGVTKTVSYSTTGGEDQVVFTSAPLDIYYYEVVDSPVSTDIGKKLSVQVPRDFSTYVVSREYSNEHNGELPDLPDDVFPHTMGDLWSYPSAAEKDSLRSSYGGYEYGPEPVGQVESGSGVTELEIAVDWSNAYTISKDFSTEIAVSGGSGGVTLSQSLGFTTGYAYSSSSGTTFGGTVGYLPGDYYDDASYSYSSGLFAVPYEDTERAEATDQSWWALNYWVE
ncbi:MAG TPA: hypothetical protein ENN41_02010 [Sediminispirochaeta sp.]|nr:hypothetical protein [Sediminispirochaeta sp.]